MIGDTTHSSPVILRAVAGAGIAATVDECLRFCGLDAAVPRHAKVIVKPNLCTALPDRVRPANTSPEVLAAVCEAVLGRTGDIRVVEADNLRQTADDAFAATGYREIRTRLGIQLVNLSREPTVPLPGPGGRVLQLPRILLECDALITVPVLKTHALTYFTGALKNQWGCVPQYDRILLHKDLDELLVFLQRVLRPRIALMDGIVAMDGRGPVNGTPRPLGILLAGRDLVALDATAMRLTGLEPRSARHVLLAAERGLGNFEERHIAVDGEWARHATVFKPAVKDAAITAMNYMSRYSWFVKYALERDSVFYPVRAVVQALRQAGLIQGASR